MRKHRAIRFSSHYNLNPIIATLIFYTSFHDDVGFSKVDQITHGNVEFRFVLKKTKVSPVNTASLIPVRSQRACLPKCPFNPSARLYIHVRAYTFIRNRNFLRIGLCSCYRSLRHKLPCFVSYFTTASQLKLRSLRTLVY
jgi:hypothetical protein